MRVLLLLLFLFPAKYPVLQGQEMPVKPWTNADTVNFLTKIDIEQATKDGIYLNGYVVNIPYNKIVKLNGMTVRIKGKVTIAKGTKYYTDGEIRQGREEDTKYILKPKIRVITD